MCLLLNLIGTPVSEEATVICVSTFGLAMAQKM